MFKIQIAARPALWILDGNNVEDPPLGRNIVSNREGAFAAVYLELPSGNK